MRKYKVESKISQRVIIKIIECREMTIKDGAYCFWSGEYGSTNRLLWAFPVRCSIVEGIYETATKS